MSFQLQRTMHPFRYPNLAWAQPPRRSPKVPPDPAALRLKEGVDKVQVAARILTAALSRHARSSLIRTPPDAFTTLI